MTTSPRQDTIVLIHGLRMTPIASNRAPLLFVAFEEDHIVPAKASRHNAEKYESGVVAFKSFPGRPHLPGAPGGDDALSSAAEQEPSTATG